MLAKCAKHDIAMAHDIMPDSPRYALLAEIRSPNKISRKMPRHSSCVVSATELLQQAMATIAACDGSFAVRLPNESVTVAEALRLCASMLHERDDLLLCGKPERGVLPRECPDTYLGCVPEGGNSICSSWVQRAPEPTVLHDRLASANIAVALPACKWNGKLLILAHGFRQPGMPHLAELDAASPFVSKLVASGWCVSSTSYSVQGHAVVQGVRDVLALREWIIQRFGRPAVCVLEGRSMGGAVATLVAEGQYGSEGAFDGVVAIGAALLLENTTEGEDQVKFTHAPLVPALFLTNQSELGPIVRYLDTAKLAASSAPRESSVAPALWEVWREGHNLVSSHERLAALSGLLSWLDHGTFITARHKNVYLPALHAASAISPALGRAKIELKGTRRPSAQVAVVNIDPTFGNVALDLQPELLYQMRISINRTFTLISTDGDEHEIKYVAYPFIVPAGSLFAYDHPEGWLTVAVADSKLFGALRGEAGVRPRADERLRLSAHQEVRVLGPEPSPSARGRRRQSTDAEARRGCFSSMPTAAEVVPGYDPVNHELLDRAAREFFEEGEIA